MSLQTAVMLRTLEHAKYTESVGLPGHVSTPCYDALGSWSQTWDRHTAWAGEGDSQVGGA